MLKKSALAFALAASSTLGLSGCLGEQPSNVNTGVEKETAAVFYDLNHLEAIPATYFTAQTRNSGYDTTAVPVQTVAGCFRVASGLSQTPGHRWHRGICWGNDGHIVAKIETSIRSKVKITSLTPQPR